MEAKTLALPFAAFLEISTPARLISATLSASSCRLENETVCSECVGEDHLAACIDVSAGDFLDFFGLS